MHCLNTLFSKLAINQSIIFCNSVNRCAAGGRARGREGGLRVQSARLGKFERLPATAKPRSRPRLTRA